MLALQKHVLYLIVLLSAATIVYKTFRINNDFVCLSSKELNLFYKH